MSPFGDRVEALDTARGLIMVIMAIDHVVYFVGRYHPAEFWNVASPVFPNVAFEVIRFATHLCAPGFVLFAGMGLSLSHSRRVTLGESSGRIRRGLLFRALLLFLLVQLFLENMAWGLGELGGRGVALNDATIPGNPTTGPFAYFGVIFAISASLAVGALFLSSPDWLIGVVGALAIVVSPVALLVGPGVYEPIKPILGILVYPGLSVVYTAYPLFPWVGVMLVGMLIGRRLARRRTVRGVANGGLIVFTIGVAARFVVPFGETTPFAGIATFFDLSKYPPSLAFLGITIGLNLIALETFDAAIARWGRRGIKVAGMRALRAFGREPLVFYVAHLFLYGVLSFVFVFPDQPVPLVAVWATSLVPLYVLVAWYRRVRDSGRLPRPLSML